MDLRGWKKVVLNWIAECQFIEKNYLTIEQTNIEDFFGTFAVHAQIEMIGPPDTRNRRTLQAFLRDIYPHFAPHYNSHGRLVSSDYLYVYTLLMHYACVLNPCKYFHDACKNLSGSDQECIAGLFKQTVDCHAISREILRQAIVNLAELCRRSHLNTSSRSRSLSYNQSPPCTRRSSSSTSTSDNPQSCYRSCLSTSERPGRSRSSESRHTNQGYQGTNNLSPLSQYSSRSTTFNLGVDTMQHAANGKATDQTNGGASLPSLASPSSFTECSELQSTPPGVALPSLVDEPLNNLNGNRTGIAIGNRNGLENEIYVGDPATPKSALLQQRTREVMGLRALLETERNEKIELEEQIIDNNTLMEKLARENRLGKEKLSRLASQQENDNGSETPDKRVSQSNEYECLKRRLFKQIEQKDAIIAEATDKLETLNAKNHALDDKLKQSEKQVRVSVERILELEARVDTLEQTLASKVDELRCMEQDKLEVERCLEETQKAVYSQREALNSTGDYLNISSSTSITSTPENLGCSVVDKVLREKELENAQLHEELQAMIRSRNQMAENLQKLIRDQAQQYNLECQYEAVFSGLGQLEQPETQFQLIERYSSMLGNILMRNQLLATEFRDQTEVISQRNRDMHERLDAATKNAESLQNDLTNAVCENLQIERYKNDLEQANMQQAEFTQELEQANEMLKERMEDVTAEMDMLRDQLAQRESMLNDELNKLQTELRHNTKELQKLQNDLQEQKSSARKVNMESLSLELEEVRAREQQLKKKYEKLVLRHEGLRSNSTETNKHLEVFRIQLTEKEQQMAELGGEIREVRNMNIELESRLNNLMHDRNKEMDYADAQLHARQARINILEGQLAKEQNVVKHVRDKYTAAKNALLAQNDRMTQLVDRLDVCDWDEAVEYIDELVSVKKNADSKLDTLKAANNNQVGRIEDLERRLKVSMELQQTLVQTNELQVQELLSELERSKQATKDAEKHTEDLGQRNKFFIEELRKDLIKQEGTIKDERAAKMDLMAKLTKTMEELEAQDVAAIDMVALLAQHLGANSEPVGGGDSPNSNSQRARESISRFGQLQARVTQFVQNYRMVDAQRQVAERKSASALLKMEKLSRALDEQERLRDESEVSAAKMSNQLKHLNVTIRNLEEVNDKLKKDADRLQTELAQRKAQKEALVAQLGAVEQQLREVDQSKTNQLLELDAQNQKLVLQLKEKTDEFDQISATLASKCEQLNVIQSEFEWIKGEFDVSKMTIDRKVSVIEELKFAMNMHRQDLAAITAQAQDSKTQNTALLEQLVQANEGRSQAEKELKLLNTKLDQSNQELSQLRESLLGLEENRESLKQLLALAEKAAATARNQYESLLQEHSQQLASLQEAEAARLTALQNHTKEAERKLLLSDTELMSLRSQLQHNLQEYTKLDVEYKKTRQQLEEGTKRIEKMAVQLGELQATVANQQREIFHHEASADAQTKALESLRSELRIHKEKTLKSAANEELLAVATKDIEELNGKLEKARREAEQQRAIIQKLEKLRDSNEKKLRDQQTSLIRAEQENVNLSHEVGGLNLEIEQRKSRDHEQAALLAEANKALGELRTELEANVDRCNQMGKDLTQAWKENAQLTERVHSLEEHYSRDTKQRKLSEKEFEKQQSLVLRLQSELDDCRNKETSLERNLKNYQALYETVKDELDQKMYEFIQYQTDTETRLHEDGKRREDLEKQLAEKNSDLIGDDESNDKVAVDRSKLQQLELDCQILQAKYKDAKQKCEDLQDQLKEQRLELEGKLEKMKTKMKVLYNEEISRMKLKQERELVSSKAELEALTAENAKYKEHTEKLSTQIVRLNDKILEHQKQQAFLSAQLRHIQATQSHAESQPVVDSQPFKRPNILLASSTSTKAAAVNLGTNLAMEDEEGEVFNNTYLTDLKMGRVPDSMTAEELQYRNSLQPPHLKSAYAAQYDLGAHEDDLKEGLHGLDDSMSALLSSTNGGSVGGGIGVAAALRKKSLGTHYKRPGPPTPSKNGGRLSFGGSSDPPREILRETCDIGGNSGSAKTPARFKLFTSRFSMGGGGGLPTGSSSHSRDEKSRRKGLLAWMQNRQMRGEILGVFSTSTPRIRPASSHGHRRIISNKDGEEYRFWTSTPRKTCSFYNQWRLIPQSDAGGQSEDQTTPKLSTSALRVLTGGQVRRLKKIENGVTVARRLSPSSTRVRKRGQRVSLCLTGNLFAKSSALVKRFKTLNRNHEKRIQQRLRCYDKGRLIVDDSDEEEEQIEEEPIGKQERNRTRSLPINNNTFNMVNQNTRCYDALSATKDGTSISVFSPQFEADSMGGAWTTHYFEQICRNTANTAPFEVQPIQYADVDASTVAMNVFSTTTHNSNTPTTTNITTSTNNSSTVYSRCRSQFYRVPSLTVIPVAISPSPSQIYGDNRIMIFILVTSLAFFVLSTLFIAYLATI